jgi:hypothetical protein
MFIRQCILISVYVYLLIILFVPEMLCVCELIDICTQHVSFNQHVEDLKKKLTIDTAFNIYIYIYI